MFCGEVKQMEIDYKVEYEKLRTRYNDVYDAMLLAQAKLTQDPCTIGIVRESKIDRQRQALRKLNRRVRVQRLQLRRLNELERGLRTDEWNSLKEEFSHELAEDQWVLED